MITSLYLDKNTLIHNLHPITKIISLILTFALALTFIHPLFLLPLLLLVLFVGAISRTLRNLRIIFPLLVALPILSLILWTIFRAERGLPHAILYGLAMGIRLDTLMISGLIFLSCIRVEEFTYGLNKLGIPFRVSFAFSLAFRFLPTLLSTAGGVVEAQRSRGLELESGGIVRKVKNHIPLLIPIFMYAIRKTDTLAMALEGRGFGFKKERTYHLQFEMKLTDYIILLTFPIFVFLCFCLRMKGIGCV